MSSGQFDDADVDFDFDGCDRHRILSEDEEFVKIM